MQCNILQTGVHLQTTVYTATAIGKEGCGYLGRTWVVQQSVRSSSSGRSTWGAGPKRGGFTLSSKGNIPEQQNRPHPTPLRGNSTSPRPSLLFLSLFAKDCTTFSVDNTRCSTIVTRGCFTPDIDSTCRPHFFRGVPPLAAAAAPTAAGVSPDHCLTSSLKFTSHHTRAFASRASVGNVLVRYEG